MSVNLSSFEKKHITVTEKKRRTKKLIGHVQVVDLGGGVVRVS